jgi:hypothetical protein
LILRSSPRSLFSTSSPLAALVAPLLAACLVGACGKARDASDEGRDEFAGETRDTAIKHEACDPAGKTVKTLKAEDRLDKTVHYVTHVFDGARELCSFSDINGDGRVDLWTYFDETGAPRRHEAAYGVDKNVTEIATYKSGQLDVVARDTMSSNRLDTWDHYANGKIVSRERDKNGDGRLDEWWTFEQGDQANIVQADPRTGKPDPATAMKVEVGFMPGGVATASGARPPQKPTSAPAATSAAPASSAAPSAAASKVKP